MYSIVEIIHLMSGRCVQQGHMGTGGPATAVPPCHQRLLQKFLFLELLFFELRSFDSFELQYNAFPVSLKGCFLSVT